MTTIEKSRQILSSSKMRAVRCNICRKQLPTLRLLNGHMLKRHTKAHLIKHLIKDSILKPKIKHKKPEQHLTLSKNVRLLYANDTLTIEDETYKENLYEFIIDNSEKPLEKLKRNKNKRQIRIEVKQIRKSLDEKTGSFYNCHCMLTGHGDDVKVKIEENKFFCKSCGNGYATNEDLVLHEMQHQYYCKICNRNYSFSEYREHFIEQHLTKLYICHICGIEFIRKDILQVHLNYHFEQQTFENVLDMENAYPRFDSVNFYGTGAGNDYYSAMNNIVSFLTLQDPFYDQGNNNSNMFSKIICDICYRDVFIFDYERHVKMMHC